MTDKKYVLMKWKDGWQEVLAIDGDAIDFDKYYVIERKEYFGRLVYNMPESEYPGLIVIDRAPMEIEQIVMMEGDDERDLKQVSTYKEGDRIEYNYELQKDEGSLIVEVSKKVKEVLAKRGISEKEVLSKCDSERFNELEAIAKDARINGSKKQDDVVGFTQMIIEKLG